MSNLRSALNVKIHFELLSEQTRYWKKKLFFLFNDSRLFQSLHQRDQSLQYWIGCNICSIQIILQIISCTMNNERLKVFVSEVFFSLCYWVETHPDRSSSLNDKFVRLLHCSYYCDIRFLDCSKQRENGYQSVRFEPSPFVTRSTRLSFTYSDEWWSKQMVKILRSIFTFWSLASFDCWPFFTINANGWSSEMDFDWFSSLFNTFDEKYFKKSTF